MSQLLQSLPDARGGTVGDSGRVGVIGGSVGFPGQPSLTALAALRAGSDVSKALVSEEIYSVVASHSPDLVVDRYPGERYDDRAVESALELAEWVESLVVGPGLVDADPDAIRRTVDEADVPVVVDADAIDPLLHADLSGAVVTPDDNEVDRIEEEHESLEEFTAATGAVAVAKSDVDVIVADGERTTNDTGSPVMTVVGTGDTMAGVIAALSVQGLDRRDAAELGAWIVGKAGELATVERGNGIVTTDIIEKIPDTVQ
ncbi:NAD(P)H-hydrate dehydratase [Halogeometricum sp. S1BR25-6]|uniref:ADP-dependent (S)-NAD(P)H-hydrate dehydratase n=1 Tax=Halogeometricum salsisoli TaxID=2950536 RepID=A0ABU2GG28_9EURY|nr:NAD(P)H-hydrate dehydratase [Halogeometricum sp. S1BR25-6]MDS0299757.1 NAD(P)H-hydrate dehydratase [Halogeometricum sp. S1BR25-6]